MAKDGIGYFLKALQIMGVVSQWSVTALEDQKVTAVEAAQLVEALCEILGVPTEVDLADKLTSEM